MNERRKQPRLNVRLRAVVRGNRSKSWNARTLDVSRGGALLDSPRSLAGGASIELLFELDQVEVAAVGARVLRCESAFWGRRHTVAVQFEKEWPALVLVAERRTKKRKSPEPVVD
jgi:PilZ domain-containing protein